MYYRFGIDGSKCIEYIHQDELDSCFENGWIGLANGGKLDCQPPFSDYKLRRDDKKLCCCCKSGIIVYIYYIYIYIYIYI